MEFHWNADICMLVLLLQMSVGLYGKLDLEYFMEANCTASEPNKCPPYAKCHDYEHYCDKGEVKSCFPPDISTNDTAILEWCGQSNISSLLDATCRFACHSKFQSKFVSKTSEKSWSVDACFPQHIADDSKNLFLWCQTQIKEDFTSLPHLSCKFACFDKFNASELYQSSPNENGISSDYLWGLAFFLLVSVVVNIVLSGCLYRTMRGQHPAKVDSKASGDRNQKKQSVAPTVKDSREDDRKLHQPVPNNEALPSGTNRDQVQGKNSNTLGKAPRNQHEKARGHSLPRTSVASSPSASYKRDLNGTIEEQANLILRGNAVPQGQTHAN